MKNMTFRATTMWGFVSVIGIFTIIIALCIFELRQIQHGVNEINGGILPTELLVDQMALDVVQVQQYLTDVSATHERDGFSDAALHAKSFNEGLDSLRKRYASQQDKLRELDELATSFAAYNETGKRMAEAYIANGIEAGNEIMKQPNTGFDAVAEDISKKMSVFRNEEITNASSKVSNLNDSAVRASNISIGVGLLAIAFGLGLAWRISGNLLNILGIEPMYAKGIAKEIAKGDLSRDITVNAGDNSSLLFAMRAMQLKLREMINEVSSNAKEIVSSAHHLSEAAQMVSFSAMRQNDAASSVASAVEEMTASIGQIASNADHSDKVAKQAGLISDQGGQVVSEAVDEMNRIAGSVSHSADIIRQLGDSSRKISEIVNVIKEIADQTNLLALNAAIEAARAGEQGRGFAVVADEVRNLAARTTKSTQEISAMVEAIQKDASNAVISMEQGTQRVTEGVEKAQRAGASMAQIKVETEQVVHTVAGITEAIKEQSATVNMVAGEVESIASMVNENKMQVDDLAKTSIRLNQLSESLNESISHFKA